MIFLRSTLFNLYFFGFTTIACLGLLWALLLPPKRSYRAILWYFKMIYYGEKFIIGLDYRVEGRENLPENGAYIIAMKHYSAYETLKLFLIFGHIAIIMKKGLMWIPLWGWYAAKMKMIPVDRAARDRAMNSILAGARPVIAEGRPIMIFPQGTRVKTTDTIEDKPYKYGIIRLYDKLNVPIVPVAINSGLFWKRNAYIKKPGVVTFRILPPIEAGLPMEKAFAKMRDSIEEESRKLLKDSSE